MPVILSFSFIWNWNDKYIYALPAIVPSKPYLITDQSGQSLYLFSDFKSLLLHTWITNKFHSGNRFNCADIHCLWLGQTLAKLYIPLYLGQTPVKLYTLLRTERTITIPCMSPYRRYKRVPPLHMAWPGPWQYLVLSLPILIKAEGEKPGNQTGQENTIRHIFMIAEERGIF